MQMGAIDQRCQQTVQKMGSSNVVIDSTKYYIARIDPFDSETLNLIAAVMHQIGMLRMPQRCDRFEARAKKK